MQKKLNEDFIELYSEQFAAKISDDFFSTKTFINGQEILNISPSKQVNFFVIKLLFNNWQLESQRLESPFFDYSAPDVKEAMVQFMNVLSRYIKVGRAEFEILLQDAVRDTLFLIMAPSVYMEIEMDRRGTEEITEKTAKNILKYLKISKDQFSEYLMKNVGMDRDEIEINDDIISEQVLLEEISFLNEVIPLTLQLLEEGQDDEPVEEVVEQVEVKEKEVENEEDILNVETGDVFKSTVARSSEAKPKGPSDVKGESEVESQPAIDADSVIEEPLLEKVTDEKHEEELADPKEFEQELEEPPMEEPEVEKSDSPIQGKEESSVEKSETSAVSSIWQFNASDADEDTDITENEPPAEIITNIDPEDEEEEEEDEDILNAKFEDPTSEKSIAEAHENQVDSMMTAISLNQRFMFINELFDGEPEAFKEAIDMVDACSSFDESVEKLVQNYARDYHWDMNAEEVKELLKIIFRRFR